MCNGDLGMYRVMPWAYPTIPGQSSGGASVEPIPEPDTPYNLDDCTLVFDQPFGNIYTPNAEDTSKGYFIGWFLHLKDLITYDSSNVSSVAFELLSGNVLTKEGGTIPVSNIKNSWVDVNTKWTSVYNSINSSSTAFTAGLTRSYGSSFEGQTVSGFSSGSIMKVTVYDSDGNVLQSSEVPIQ